MKLSTVLANAAIITGSLVSAELDPIVIKGSKFFYKSDGTEFFMRGIAYQEEYSGDTSADVQYTDPLADPDACARDVPLLEELYTNTIRVYAIDPEADHTECMQLLDDAGIYVVADLSQPSLSIIRDDPKWNDDLYGRYTAVIDELSQYSNVIGFFAGNEVTNNSTNTNASAFVKAAVRDMKAYIKYQEYRPMGVGYATNDDSEIRDYLADYFACNAAEESVDFWGYNIYSWCGDSTIEEAGYDKVASDFEDYPAPLFFAEYGCIEVTPREFTEVGAIFGSELTPVLSGGIVYMYHEEANGYGLVEIDSSEEATKKDDFAYLKDEMANVDPEGVTMDEYEPSGELRTCPEVSDDWHASSTLPPTPNRELCECMTETLSCVVAEDVDDDDLGDLFGTVCGMDETACYGTYADAETGVYGAYSMCNPREQLSHAFNAYYVNQGESNTACDFEGSATTQEGSEAEGQCASLIEEAGGPEGTGTMTSAPTAGSNSGSSTGTSSSSSGAAQPLGIPAFNFGAFQLGAYVLCTMMAGAGVILL